MKCVLYSMIFRNSDSCMFVGMSVFGLHRLCRELFIQSNFEQQTGMYSSEMIVFVIFWLKCGNKDS